MNCKISVIVPVYNVEKYLNRCVESIVNQTYEKLEIILVDDGSPDNCPQMCDEWAGKDSRIKVIHKQNGGVSSARNAALDAATGYYIGFVDSDDYIEPEMYEKLILSTNNCLADMACCSFAKVCDGVEYEDWYYNENKFVSGKDIVIQYISDKLCEPGMPNKILKKSIIDKHHLRFDKNKKIGEDFLFNFYFLLNSENASVIADNLYKYVQLESSATHSSDSNMIKRWKNTLQLINEVKDEEIHTALLIKYASELLCCIKDLLCLKSKELIADCYKEICDEIKKNSKVFLSLDIAKKDRLRIKAICFNSYLFKVVYNFYLKRRLNEASD